MEKNRVARERVIRFSLLGPWGKRKGVRRLRHLIRRLCCRYFWIGSDWFGLGRWCSVGLEALFKTQKVRLTLEASVVFHVQSRWTPVVRHSSGLFVFTLVGETVRIDESIIKSECPTFVEKKKNSCDWLLSEKNGRKKWKEEKEPQYFCICWRGTGRLGAQEEEGARGC